jgi:opacity protein-like surface antigen
MQIQLALKLSLFCALAAGALPAVASAQKQEESEVERQARLARRGAGVRVGIWNVDVESAEDPSKSLHFEGYFQRGLDKHLALESSAGVWWVSTTVTQPLPGSQPAENKSYVIPLLTSLKLFPLTEVGDKLEPFIMAGVGFALGVADESDNTIGGGGTSLVTGFGLRGGGGLELRLSSAFGASASAKYQWVKFGEELGGMDTFNGLGFEGGITYRFQF